MEWRSARTFSNLLLILFAVGLIPAPVIAYSDFWALNIRRALAVRLYRTQALGVFLVGLAVIGYIFTWDLYNGLGIDSNLYTTLEILFSFAIPPIVTFYWIDSSVRIARRSDPLLRDVLHWKIVRVVLWAWIGVAFLSLVVAVGSSALYDAMHGLLNSTSSSGPPALGLFLFLLSPIFVVAITGPIVLRRAAKWTGDRRFAKHLLWFGLFIFFVLISLVAIFLPLGSGFAGSLQFQIEVAIPEIIGGYCLYKSVRWLVPLNPLPSVSNDKKEAQN